MKHMENKNILWYSRCDGVIKGPFTGAIIRKNLIIGRLSMHHEVSHDQKNWQQLQFLTSLHPDVSGQVMEKTKINLDERNGYDRRDLDTSETKNPENLREGTERRLPENERTLHRRQLHTQLLKKIRDKHQQILLPFLVVFLSLIIIAVIAILSPQQQPKPLADCSSHATPHVNWSNCLKPNINLHGKDLTNARLANSHLAGANFTQALLNYADLSYVDLQRSILNGTQLNHANLMGANLKNANLNNANLSNANLSYADLTGANLIGSNLDNARFDHAIWTSGQRCAPQSIGKCIIR